MLYAGNPRRALPRAVPGVSHSTLSETNDCIHAEFEIERNFIRDF